MKKAAGFIVLALAGACTEKRNDPVNYMPMNCPVGQIWNGSMCVTSSNPTTCPAGQIWSGSGCVVSSTTPGMGGNSGVGGLCPTGQVWSGSTCVYGTVGGSNGLPYGSGGYGVGGGTIPVGQCSTGQVDFQGNCMPLLPVQSWTQNNSFYYTTRAGKDCLPTQQMGAGCGGDPFIRQGYQWQNTEFLTVAGNSSFYNQYSSILSPVQPYFEPNIRQVYYAFPNVDWAGGLPSQGCYDPLSATVVTLMDGILTNALGGRSPSPYYTPGSLPMVSRYVLSASCVPRQWQAVQPQPAQFVSMPVDFYVFRIQVSGSVPLYRYQSGSAYQGGFYTHAYSTVPNDPRFQNYYRSPVQIGYVYPYSQNQHPYFQYSAVQNPNGYVYGGNTTVPLGKYPTQAQANCNSKDCFL